MSHTPGEWFLQQSSIPDPDAYFIYGGKVGSTRIAKVMYADDARLITKTPQLLDACKQLTVAIAAIKARLAQPINEREQKAVDELFRLYTLGQTAIAAAEGR